MLEATGINKRRAVSEIISYVILIVIVLGISAAVYQWMLTSTPAISETCPEDVSLYIKSYNCSDVGCSSGKCLSLTIKNNGNFNIDGFFIRTSNNISAVPATGLEYADMNYEGFDDFKETGRFYFKMMGGGFEGLPLKPGTEIPLVFNYQNIIRIIQIEPFVEGKSSLQICKDSTINIEVDDSKNCG